MQQLTPTTGVSLAIALRLALLAWSHVQDQTMAVKYTDIDYSVFTDAAALVASGGSPYDRATYRYTPLLAWLLSVVNGKLLFCVSDLVAGLCIHGINRLSLLEHGKKLSNTLYNFNLELALWALNPFVAVISTRGNAESIIAALVLLCIYLLKTKQTILAALAFGLAVHLKVYAIIYALPLWLFIDCKPQTQPPKPSTRSKSRSRSSSRARSKSVSRKVSPKKEIPPSTTLLSLFTSFFTPSRFLFGAISGSLFLALTYLFYTIYGHPFLEHTYLYHITRQDHRHNFSPYFYHLYLTSTTTPSKLSGLLAFLPQLGVSSFVGAVAAARGDIVFAVFAQTWIFVMLNKVITSQYFMWYLCFLPIVLQRTRIQWQKGLGLVVLWVIGQAVWLLNAYRLEHLGENTFRRLHFAGLLFLAINTFVLVEMTKGHELEGEMNHSEVKKKK
ncbi:hypothetical protein BCR33DRAFT_719473 [Rhizoclosmatium globosum]|uniref:GPI mannosyltransferase 1 n=1 Tax=Rhizoclosmatium globosum TaxID=329046 RepID=A0A1Y2C2H4_9FUNG|nr:hypothetical protein BCR33DRAFT_719473 [Rhizoclosmatium globosum]|eukprot:ORY40515.1 hypothetical protein BCR33DRAFT_719473 [Rhizoclosmatium globosum]